MKATLAFVAAFALEAAFGDPLQLGFGWNGTLRFGSTEAKITTTVHAAGWAGTSEAMVSPEAAQSPTERQVTFRVDNDLVLAGRVAIRDASAASGAKRDKITLDVALKVLKDFETEGVVLALRLPVSTFGGGSWTASTGLGGTFAREWNGKAICLYSQQTEWMEFARTTGERFRLTVPGGTHAMLQDNRHWNDDTFTMRLSLPGGKSLKKGTDRRIVCEISAPDGVALQPDRQCVVKASADWIPVDYRKDILAGSALDLSGAGLQDAPAGKYGWLRNEGGHFAFEKRPGVAQRFYGVNLCFDACFPDKAVADLLVTRLVRLGYNTVRIHHYESPSGLLKGTTLAKGLNAERFARLDYLIAKCIAAGIYVTTDLYTCRVVAWREIGIDRDGRVPQQMFKALVAVYEPAYQNWCELARQLLTHVNPHTGRAYKDEPGLPLISLINENTVNWCWAQVQKEAPMRTAWETWRKAHPTQKDDKDAFFADIERRMFARQRAFLRDLGVKALFTNQNCGPHSKELSAVAKDLYDYVDNHFYVDHPQFLGRHWALPSRCDNRNPVCSVQPPYVRVADDARISGKPFCVTEWNFSGPGMYRGCGGILTGATGAQQCWDGLWRFAYSHSARSLVDGSGAPGYFDLASDPLGVASDRASICLFLRGDLDEKAPANALTLDRERGSFTIVTPRTAGGFAPSGRLTAGDFSFDIRKTAATVWASSLDGRPLTESRHLLVSHVTDVQADGNVYADEAKTIILKWGAERSVARNGQADVELTTTAQALTVWALETSGRRLEKIPSRLEGGKLLFTACVKGPHGARMLYEVAGE